MKTIMGPPVPPRKSSRRQRPSDNVPSSPIAASTTSTSSTPQRAASDAPNAESLGSARRRAVATPPVIPNRKAHKQAEEKKDGKYMEKMSANLGTRSPILHRWIILAMASGCFAALNGAFAKLTTTSLTTSIAASVSNFLNAAPDSFLLRAIELATRGFFFAMNIGSNGIMWALFTRALTAHSSATKVTLVNTSANFVFSAIIGWLIFGEQLKGLWWLGAACLVIGNLILGRGREDEEGKVGLEKGNTKTKASATKETAGL